ncbi:YlbF family regulator [Gemella sp. GH3]|uniref:YlbF family regulator n=1 Tax=unclassified Gemella TaxID=2624949 RepID=UPI0015D0252D|nr:MULTISPECIES: YlbF family regulator [unclassified Gemella]MBF0713830.1 YlbF family regulator [Gemella sp. GH3.1]NYS50782.1 YlbF family regulator [Gemella sp. GH3]
MNIYDKANEFEKSLRESDVYKDLVEAFENLEKNAESKNLYKEFIDTQSSFMQSMQTGEQPSEEQLQSFQQLQEKLVADENVSKLIQAQQRLQVTIEDINKVIYKPLEELFNKYEK